MGTSECRGKPPNALRAKGVEKEEEEEDFLGCEILPVSPPLISLLWDHNWFL
jgi:hypothetical protein